MLSRVCLSDKSDGISKTYEEGSGAGAYVSEVDDWRE